MALTNIWKGKTHAGDFRQGGRIYVQENLYAPGLPRPPYTIGDEFHVEENNGVYAGKIIGVAPDFFDIDFKGTKLRLKATPSHLPPPALVSVIPFDDRMAEVLPPVSGDKVP